MVTVEKKRRETGNCRLTDPKVKNAKPSEDAKAKGQMTTLRDGDGLELRISAAGSKLWCSPPPKMKKTCGENEKLSAQ